ncbi:carboxymuconolactone decarboxylase family protein [Miniphocaeibacter massiliensis]|uniref:carboxymuconolactone decarboxylase family protein n=1 Tax=Miniphocaeibacter massiliensis TaxID=2041841 RepID=UPI000C1C0B63|nr:carboxymuconolactone decarboxylase family protein [Miniphocaeibacter massiliensis]
MSYKEKLEIGNQNTKNVFSKCPEVGESFSKLHGSTIRDGVVSAKNRELIALGIAIAIRCEGCIVAHVAAAKKAGVTLEEIYETIEVAILMGGGPSVAYGGIAAACAEEFYN